MRCTEMEHCYLPSGVISAGNMTVCASTLLSYSFYTLATTAVPVHHLLHISCFQQFRKHDTAASGFHRHCQQVDQCGRSECRTVAVSRERAGRGRSAVCAYGRVSSSAQTMNVNAEDGRCLLAGITFVQGHRTRQPTATESGATAFRVRTRVDGASSG
jgi:hypothetical protein